MVVIELHHWTTVPRTVIKRIKNSSGSSYQLVCSEPWLQAQDKTPFSTLHSLDPSSNKHCQLSGSELFGSLTVWWIIWGRGTVFASKWRLHGTDDFFFFSWCSVICNLFHITIKIIILILAQSLCLPLYLLSSICTPKCSVSQELFFLGLYTQITIIYCNKNISLFLKMDFQMQILVFVH